MHPMRATLCARAHSRYPAQGEVIVMPSTTLFTTRGLGSFTNFFWPGAGVTTWILRNVSMLSLGPNTHEQLNVVQGPRASLEVT
eukprot:9300994-Pyramimonas_sp.AAC.1